MAFISSIVHKLQKDRASMDYFVGQQIENNSKYQEIRKEIIDSTEKEENSMIIEEPIIKRGPKSGRWPELEEELFKQLWEKGEPISYELMRNAAKEIMATKNYNFNASNGWLSRFLKRVKCKHPEFENFLKKSSAEIRRRKRIAAKSISKKDHIVRKDKVLEINDMFSYNGKYSKCPLCKCTIPTVDIKDHILNEHTDQFFCDFCSIYFGYRIKSKKARSSITTTPPSSSSRCYYPALEEMTFNSLYPLLENDEPVNHALIRTMAMNIAIKEGIKCNISNGWLYGLKKRIIATYPNISQKFKRSSDAMRKRNADNDNNDAPCVLPRTNDANDYDDTFSCNICKQKCSSTRLLKEHIESSHSNDYMCDGCRNKLGIRIIIQRSSAKELLDSHGEICRDE